MLRTPAIENLLIEEVARVRQRGDEGADPFDDLVGARRRSLAVAIFDWIAIAILFALSDPVSDFLSIGTNERTIFTLAILAIAVHSGFRLGQWEKYRTVEAAVRSLSRLGGE